MYLSPAFVWAIVAVAICIAFFAYYRYCLKPRPHSLEWIAMAEARSRRRYLSMTLKRHPFERRDLLPMLLVTVVYALTAFFHLGSFAVPQTYTVFQTSDPACEFSFNKPVTVDKLSYYTAIGTGTYTLEYSSDGENWEQLSLKQGSADVLKWISCETGPIMASHFRIHAALTDRPEGLWMAELALWNEGEALLPDQVDPAAAALFDEADLWSDKATDQNSAYFDEVYHPRTALEHLNNVYPYEVSHPPLGKLIISVGVTLFGMCPFGWRFMGTLFGVLMLPILYVFLKNLFGKTAVALCGTCLFAFDFMHLVQTRIATIDTYGVFFILVSYYFMYRWLSTPGKPPVLPLFLCGLFWGIGCASKWIVVYAGLGLALLWLLGLISRGQEWYQTGETTGFTAQVVKTILCSILFFVVIPVCIYVASYLPYAAARGTDFPGLLKLVWDNQVFMLTYHQGVHTPHPYESHWYQWIFDIRPILYYRDLDLVDTWGIKSLFASFNNPLVSWAGLVSFAAVVIQTIRRKCGTGLFLIIALLSQLLPWLGIGRILFAYHYFPTVLFLVFCIAYVMNDMLERRRKGHALVVYGFTGCAVGLYALFYPALIGLYMPVWYSEYFLRWFPSWPL